MAPSRRVLLVDDEPDIVEAIAGWLELNLDGLEVTRASSGEAGIEALERSYDLIVSDYRMPGIDGLQFLTLARHAMPETPTVLMTAYPDVALARRAIEDVGVARFLVKPVDPDAFLQIVDDMTRNWRDGTARQQADAANREILTTLHRRTTPGVPLGGDADREAV